MIMYKLIYKKIKENRYKAINPGIWPNKEPMDLLVGSIYEVIDDLGAKDAIDYLLEGGPIDGDLVGVRGWDDDTIIIGSAEGLFEREEENPKIILNKWDLIKLLSFWLSLALQGVDEMELSSKDNTITLSGNNMSVTISAQQFKYDYEGQPESDECQGLL
jgi:hypothetical protein